ncbi:tRNA lysidine(34) synthetase TilS [Sporosarcina sp. YIM B06819]|uniref:tRNA lysidine(34) synthetase TilS n=1 Tax=Sporosarcina sp. YIM B06819 TaxID=3081769 RepID=UPI00298CF89C|nr:tRNA lysidine(34) synthetase TilS [Sporosarcina sp. YIM B06819]
MDTFRQAIFRFIKEWSLIAPGDRVLVACSGGVDSVALLHFMASNQVGMGIEVAAIHVDHMLRGEESVADGAFVERLCATYGIPFFGGSVPVPELMEQDGGNVQAVCRAGRYALFAEIMQQQGYGVLVTAHHAEDQLETVLMQVAKGSQPSGIPVKREVDGGVVIRPLLPVMKADLYSYAREYALQYREDPSNESDAYMRNRYRHHIAPFMLKENPAAAKNVVKMAGWLQQDEDLFETLAVEQFERIVEFTEEGLPTIDTRVFSDMHPALQRRVITLLLKYLYDGESIPVEYNSTLISQLLHHITSQNGNVSIDLPRGYRFMRAYSKLTFVRDTQLEEMAIRKMFPKGSWTRWGNDVELYWTEVDDSIAGLLIGVDDIMYFDLPDSDFPLYIKRREDGDRILLPGMDHPKRLSRLFIDDKVDLAVRDQLPLIVTALGEVCAVPGLRYGAAFSRRKTKQSHYIVLTRKC